MYINYHCQNYTPPDGGFGGSTCMCTKCVIERLERTKQDIKCRNSFGHEVIHHVPKCSQCGAHPTPRSEIYDAHYCRSCNIWLEPACEHEGCGFCKNRPEKPF